MLTERQFTDAAERYLDMVYRIALNWFRNPADAEDAAQNAMLRLWRTDTEFQGEDHLRHWLVRVALNECKRMSAHPWRKRTVPLERLEQLALEIEQGLQNSLDREITTDMVGQLVLEKLWKVDEVAYVRFASVYRQFKDLKAFTTELERLMAGK